MILTRLDIFQCSSEDFPNVVIFKLKFEGSVGINDTKQGEAMGAMRIGRKAHVFRMQTVGAENGQKREWKDMQGLECTDP